MTPADRTLELEPASAEPPRPPAPGGADAAWQRDPGLGVYVHVPFCARRCHYCDFNTYTSQEGLHGLYVEALLKDIERSPTPARAATSVFFGGGTPTLLPASALRRALGAVKAHVGLAGGAEVTVEVNPETVDEAVFEELLEAGFTRVSIGVQSLVPHVLERLGRTHGPQLALDAIAAAHSAGFTNVNADLIYGSPWESAEDWETSLAGVVEAEPEHVSAYALMVEEGTPLHRMVAGGRVPEVDPDVQAERHGVATEVLGAVGLVRYEISNWARPGHACRHNLLYWSAGDYLGFGAGAHGHHGGRRYWRTRLPRQFIGQVRAGSSTKAGYELLRPDERAAEALMLALRLSSGVSLDAFRARFGSQWLECKAGVVEQLRLEGLLAGSTHDLRSGWLRIPADKSLLSNEVLCRLL